MNPSRLPPAAEAHLGPLLAAAVLSPLDYQLASTLLARGREERPEVALAIAFTSRQLRLGHVCLDLRSGSFLAEGAIAPEVDLTGLPPLGQWLAALRTSPLVGPIEGSATPLVLDTEGRLYLARYARYESRLATQVLARLGSPAAADPTIKAALLRLFPQTARGGTNLQRLAALTAAHGALTIISGGPGTGKTYTVARLLALLVESCQQRTTLRIHLVAPTGKAAQRLGESMAATVSSPSFAVDDEVRRALDITPTTVHRLLGYQPRTPTRFRYNSDNPIPADIVLVDEASMVDVALMSKLVDAIPLDAKLILLGDKDQLASVEAGAILGDMCQGHSGQYSSHFAQYVAAMTGDTIPSSPELPAGGLADCIVQLTESRRYSSTSGIGRLANAINRGSPGDALAAVHESDDIALCTNAEAERLPPELAQMVLGAFAGYRGAAVETRLKMLQRLGLLCAHRRGRFGVDTYNRAIEKLLAANAELLLDTEFYDGRPVMITENDYGQELFNGDIGVVAHEATSGRRRVFFPRGDGSLRWLSPSRLPPHETVFAMTVHKSQGSEYDEVALVLPAEASPIVTRELVYTGLTRARYRVALFADEALLRSAIAKHIARASGLGDRLWPRQFSAPAAKV